MSAVLLVSADPELRDQVAVSARRAGVHVTVHADVDDALADWKGADLVLVGADRIAEAADYDLPTADRVHVVLPLSFVTALDADGDHDSEAASQPWLLPLYDESHYSDLEHDDIAESWSKWVSSDVYGHLGERAQEVWVALPAERLEELWWEVVDGLQYSPEHDGREVRWDLDRLAGPFAARLMAEFRRTFRPDPAFTIDTVPTSQRWGPRYAVLADGFPFLLTLAWSRFSAKVDLWRYQSAWRADIGQVTA